jgi:hypothetical protein
MYDPKDPKSVQAAIEACLASADYEASIVVSRPKGDNLCYFVTQSDHRCAVAAVLSQSVTAEESHTWCERATELKTSERRESIRAVLEYAESRGLSATDLELELAGAAKQTGACAREARGGGWGVGRWRGANPKPVACLFPAPLAP